MFVVDPNDDDFLPNLMEEFPHLYLAPETIHKMWMDHQQQSAAINKRLEEDKKKQSKAKTTVSGDHIQSLTGLTGGTKNIPEKDKVFQNTKLA